jgi:RNA polymerase-binding transcription factor DksA
MTSDALAAGPASARSNRMPIHPAEVAGDHFEQELAIALASSKDETLQKIEQALERIEDGVYGICDCCGRRIPQGRLDAIPYAGLCVGCARQNEEAVADLYGG